MVLLPPPSFSSAASNPSNLADLFAKPLSPAATWKLKRHLFHRFKSRGAYHGTGVADEPVSVCLDTGAVASVSHSKSDFPTSASTLIPPLSDLHARSTGEDTGSSGPSNRTEHVPTMRVRTAK